MIFPQRRAGIIHNIISRRTVIDIQLIKSHVVIPYYCTPHCTVHTYYLYYIVFHTTHEANTIIKCRSFVVLFSTMPTFEYIEF